MYSFRSFIILIALVFPLTTVADSQSQANELARCFVQEYDCVEKTAAVLSDNQSAAFEKQAFNAIQAELERLSVGDRHEGLRNLLKLEVEPAYALFWELVRSLELDFSELEDDLENDSEMFSQGFQDYTFRLIEQSQDFELASIYFDLFYFFEGSEWVDLDRFVDRIWAFYQKTQRNGKLKPDDTAHIKHIILENTANQLDKDDADFARLKSMWLISETIPGEPISAYEHLTGGETYYSYRDDYYQDVDRYYREFNKPGNDGGLPKIVNQPLAYYELRAEKVLLNRLWSDADGNTLLVDLDGQFLAFDGFKLLPVKEVWKIYGFESAGDGLLSQVLSAAMGTSEAIPYQKFSEAEGPEKRAIYVNHTLPDNTEAANYVELTLRSQYILISMDLPIPDSDDETGVKQFVFEFKSPQAALSAFDSLSDNTPDELTQTSLWYHNYDDEKQGLIVRSYVKEDGSEFLISPYRNEEGVLEFSKWESCDKPFTIESLNQDKDAFLSEESRLYRNGYRLQYFNLVTRCTIAMPWDSETDLVKRVFSGLEYYGDDEAIEELKKHRVKTRPYRLESLDISDDKGLGYSRIGGDVAIPEKYAKTFTWPEFERDGKKEPLEFLMQVDFSELNNPRWNDDLPDKGLLSIFYRVDSDGIPDFARGYYFEDVGALVRVTPDAQSATRESAQRLKPQRLKFAKELMEQYPIREMGEPYGQYNIVAKIDEDAMNDYYRKTYGIGAYSIDERAYFTVDRDYPVFMQLRMYNEDTHVILDKGDLDKPSEDGFKIIRVHMDWMGHYD